MYASENVHFATRYIKIILLIIIYPLLFFMPFIKKWTLENIKEGLEKFYKEFGKYPTALDIDKYPYLPSSRQIQRKFGGLPNLRKSLNIQDLDYTKGNLRRKIYNEISNLSFQAERNLEFLLIKKFGEPFVHIEKPVDKNSKRRFDFFIYAKNIKFAIDIFYSSNIKNIQSNINFKIDSYKNKNSAIPLYIVLDNNKITQLELDKIVTNKPYKPLPSNTKLLTLENFLKFIEN